MKRYLYIILIIMVCASCAKHKTTHPKFHYQKNHNISNDSTEWNYTFKKISYYDIPDNVIHLVKNWMLITAGTPNNFNMMLGNNGGMGYLWKRPVSFMFIKNKRYTYELLEQNKNYTISTYPLAYHHILKLMGTKSGRDINKLELSGFHKITTPSGLVAFKEANLVIECKKLYDTPLSMDYFTDKNAKNMGKIICKKSGNLSSMFISEITNIWIKK